jgi:hypothetical protein
VHLGAELARDFGRGIPRAVVHDEHVRPVRERRETQEDLTDVGGRLVCGNESSHV